MIRGARRELPALLFVMAIAIVLLGRSVGAASQEFDEQVYLASADLLSRGYQLGSEVFTSQPPLFLSALGEANAAVGGNATALRALLVLLTIAGAAAAWAIVRLRSGPLPALAAAMLVVLAPGVVEAAAVVSADVPCVAVGTLALLAWSLQWRRPAWALPAAILLCWALLTKLLAAPFAVAILVSAVVHRPPPAVYGWFAAGLAIAAGSTVLAYAEVLGPLWHGAVGLHLEARGAPVDLPRPSILVAVVLISSAYAGLLAILLAGLVERDRPQIKAWARRNADLIALFAAGFALCAVQRPLLNHHLVVIAWPLALLAGSALPSRLPSRRTSLVLAVAGALLVVPWAIHGRDTVEPAEERPLREIARYVSAETAPQATVVSDLPSINVMAGRASAPSTVDPSWVRVQTGELSKGDILAASAASQAVVVGRAFRAVPGLESSLAQRFAVRRRFGEVAVFTAPRSPPRHELVAGVSQK